MGCGYVGFCCQKEDRKYLIRSNQGREGVHYEEKMFISYSHEDSSKIKKFAFLLSLHGFDLWMDEKSLSSGDNYTTRILNGIHDSDIYLVFLSQASLKSTWVGAEIDFALREKIERGRLTIIPVLLEDVEIPVSLSNIDYLDARFSTQKAVEELSNRYQSEKIEHTDIVVSSVAFSISEETSVQIGPFNDSMTIDDLKEDSNRVLSDLRKKAYGILMNFVSAADFDFQSEKPKFTNGLYEETVIKKEGSTNGSICERITVETVVYNPSMSKVNRLMKERLEVLNINAITFGFSIPLKEGESMLDVGKRCFKKIQEDYIILSYDSTDGAKIEIADDFYLSLLFSEEIMKVKLTTKYSFQFERKMKEFSVFAFIRELLE